MFSWLHIIDVEKPEIMGRLSFFQGKRSRLNNKLWTTDSLYRCKMVECKQGSYMISLKEQTLAREHP